MITKFFSALMAFALIFLVAPSLSAQDREQPLAPGVVGAGPYSPAWMTIFPTEAERTSAIAAYNFALYGIQFHEDTGPELWRVEVHDTGTSGSLQMISVEGLQNDFRGLDLIINPFRMLMLASGHNAGVPALYFSDINSQGHPVRWNEVELPPNNRIRRILNLLQMEDFGVIIAEEASEVGLVTTAYVLDYDELEMGNATWYSLPALPYDLEGAAPAIVQDVLLLAGGIDKNQNRPSIMPVGIHLSPHVIGEWNELFRPLHHPVPHAIATSSGSSVFITPRRFSEGVSNRMMLQFTTDLGGGNIGPWRELELDQPFRNVVDLEVDAANSKFMILTDEPEGKVLTCYYVPRNLTIRRPTDDELRRLQYVDLLVNPHRPTIEEALDEAREKSQPILYIIPGNKDHDFKIRLMMRTSKFRYMTQDSIIAYMEGAEADQLMREYEIPMTPAFFMVSPEGEMLSRHVGIVPREGELLRLTAPLRMVVDSPAVIPLDSGDN